MDEDFALFSVGEVDDWCDLDPECTSPGGVPYNSSDSNGSVPINPSNTTPACAIPVCPLILSYTIENTK